MAGNSTPIYSKVADWQWAGPVITANTLNEASASAVYELPINEALPPGYKIYVTTSIVGTTGYAVTAVGGKY